MSKYVKTGYRFYGHGMVVALCYLYSGGCVRSFIPELEIKEIERLVVESLHRDLSGWKDKGFLFTTHGILDNVSGRKLAAQQARWSKVFGIKLVADGMLVINAKHELIENYNDGDRVEVVCYPTINVFNGQVQLQMELVAIRLLGEQTQKASVQIQRLSTVARPVLSSVRHVFPIRTHLHVNLIYSSASSAKVDEDFLRSLGAARRYCQIERVPVRMSSAEQITMAITECKADVLVLIRGGGAEAEFEVFNQPNVVEALVECPAYRIVGLGHSANTTLLDQVADYAASVPADAGVHLSKQIENIEHFIKGHETHESEQSIESTADSFVNQSFEKQRAIPKSSSYAKWWVALLVALVLGFIFKQFIS